MFAGSKVIWHKVRNHTCSCCQSSFHTISLWSMETVMRWEGLKKRAPGTQAMYQQLASNNWQNAVTLRITEIECLHGYWDFRSGGVYKIMYELLNLRALKISMLYKTHTFQRMGKIFCVKFQRVPLNIHKKYLTHTLKDVDFIHKWKFMSSYI